MRRLIDYFRGACRLTIRGCNPERCLDRLFAAALPFWDIHKPDEFTLCLTVYEATLPLARSVVLCCQCEIEDEEYHSFRRDFSGLKRRWALLLGLLGVVAGSIFLPNYIVALEVEGCVSTTPTQVLRALEADGVGFGAWGPSVDADFVKNRLLLRLPELRWAAINISGLRATVLITESPAPPPIVTRQGAANLISAADGVVTEVSVLNGQAACKQGDAVLEGQVLISGVVDLERCTMITRALGEVYAETRRQKTVVTPRQRVVFTADAVKGRCIWLSVGRKRIKICGSSGISMGDCVKIVRRSALQLPGGYPVPLALWIETYYRATPQPTALSEADAHKLLVQYADRWAADTLIAGQSLAAQNEFSSDEAVCRLTQTLRCREMIARSAEIPILELEQHGTNDKRGTDGTPD